MSFPLAVQFWRGSSLLTARRRFDPRQVRQLSSGRAASAPPARARTPGLTVVRLVLALSFAAASRSGSTDSSVTGQAFASDASLVLGPRDRSISCWPGTSQL